MIALVIGITLFICAAVALELNLEVMGIGLGVVGVLLIILGLSLPCEKKNEIKIECPTIQIEASHGT